MEWIRWELPLSCVRLGSILSAFYVLLTCKFNDMPFFWTDAARDGSIEVVKQLVTLFRISKLSIE